MTDDTETEPKGKNLFARFSELPSSTQSAIGILAIVVIYAVFCWLTYDQSRRLPHGVTVTGNDDYRVRLLSDRLTHVEAELRAARLWQQATPTEEPAA